MRITSDQNFIYFSDVSGAELRRLQSYHNAVKVRAGYRVPLNLFSIREIYKDFPAIQPNLYEIGVKLREQFDYLLEQKRISEHLPLPKRYDERLREYQSADVFYLSKLDCAGVFNEQRTGKTPTIIALLKTLEPSRTVIVTPASLLYNWKREFKKWNYNGNVIAVAGSKKNRHNLYSNYTSGVLIVSKDTLKMDTSIFPKDFDVIIVDEAHFLRNYKTAQSKAVFSLKGRRKYALTGTPTVKHAADVFGILHFLYPEKHTSYWQFAERYFHIGENVFGQSEILSEKKHRIEELQKIIGIISVQRKRRDVMQWLPDKERTTFYCEMDTAQRKAYNEMLEYFFVEDGEIDAPSVLAQLTRLRQICLCPQLLGINASSAKTESLVEWITESLPKGDGVIVMSMFTSYLRLLEKILESKGQRVGMIHGDLSSEEKADAAEKFQKGETDVLLCNIISAGTGFTLDRAEHIIFMDKAWNPAENEQAEDRITPTTPDKVHKHSVISFVCQNSVDEKINDMLDKKKSLTDLINEGGLQAIKKLLF
ncbi:HepA Superfamily II DNA/RNA helicases, SNF2 family [uncultured Caudovirales phage]|uniref:HepA Superfamily II DNA/RNA helicases, SNF2 family n=1 Tax=uncultured Caudovirales phage TaxID=2100421 RepID=A0A6J5MFZ1_9CAUD|nr:HepA Superfamily II DNA/RNA helicases, SNF2 family [uncultured Caudovirales phage]